MQAIVIAHNDEDSDLLSFLLRKRGMAVATSKSLQRVIPTLAERPVDILLVSTRAESTLVETVRKIRSVTQIPLLLLLDLLTEDQHCDLLDAGVDLVLERPVSNRLLARYIARLLRKTDNIPVSVLPEIKIGGFVLNPAVRTITHQAGEPQRLTQLEFRLLYVLMTNPGHIFSTDEIVERVWGYDGEGNRGLVRGLVSRLRRKIEPNPDTPVYIENVPSVGYRFSPP